MVGQNYPGPSLSNCRNCDKFGPGGPNLQSNQICHNRCTRITPKSYVGVIWGHVDSWRFVPIN